MMTQSDKAALWALINGWAAGAGVLTVLYIKHCHPLPTLAAMVVAAMVTAVLTVRTLGTVERNP